jgi:hypothetical protein
MCRLSWNLGASTCWNPQGLSRPVMGLLFTVYVELCFFSFEGTVCLHPQGDLLGSGSFLKWCGRTKSLPLHEKIWCEKFCPITASEVRLGTELSGAKGDLRLMKIRDFRLSCCFTQRRLVVYCRSFGPTYHSQLQRSDTPPELWRWDRNVGNKQLM